MPNVASNVEATSENRGVVFGKMNSAQTKPGVTPSGSGPSSKGPIQPGFLTHGSIVDRMTNPPAGTLPLITYGPELAALYPTPDDYANTWFCDLHLGPEAVLSYQTELKRLGWLDPIVIQPGEFGVLLTEERVHIPGDIAGFISLRFGMSKHGLINISGRHVDPGYEGRLIFTVYNAGPNAVPMRRGDRVFMISFGSLDSTVAARRSPTHQQIDTIPSDFLTSLHGPPQSLEALRTKVATLEDRAETSRLILIGILTAGVSATLAFIGWLFENRIL